MSSSTITMTHEEELHAMTTQPEPAWGDPRSAQDQDIRRANLAERTRINTAISDAAQR
jgi:hypothetical protein